MLLPRRLQPRLLRLLKGVTHGGAHSYRSLVNEWLWMIKRLWTPEQVFLPLVCSGPAHRPAGPSSRCNEAPICSESTSCAARALGVPIQEWARHVTGYTFSAPTAGGIGDIGPCQYLPSITAMFAITACSARQLTSNHLSCSLALAAFSGQGLACLLNSCLSHHNDITLLTPSLTIWVWEHSDGGLVGREDSFVVVERRERRSTARGGGQVGWWWLMAYLTC